MAGTSTGHSGSSALSAAPTGGGGSGSSGGMALTAHTGGGGGVSGTAQSGTAGSGTNPSSGTGGWGPNPRNGSSYGQGLGASPTATAPGAGGGGDPFGSGSGSSSGSGGRLPSGVAATTTVASAGTNQGLPDNNCDLEEKVFTPACFDIMNDYCTTTHRQGSGCKSFCRTNSASTACAGSK
ncbi:MAG: hypothetical protein IPK68_11650 [Bdellovibrionales bacterium]|nr:hypothetical protein [Bdellovibrionales bacterium]